MSVASTKPLQSTNGTPSSITSGAPSSQSTTTNGRNSTAGKKKTETPAVDPVSMYESVRSRIAALEEEEGLEEEEDNRMGEVSFTNLFPKVKDMHCLLELTND